MKDMYVLKPSELIKAMGGKYISKKRGPDGKWIYKYVGVSQGGSGQSVSGKHKGDGYYRRLEQEISKKEFAKIVQNRANELREKWIDQGMKLDDLDKHELETVKLYVRGLEEQGNKNKIVNPDDFQVRNYHRNN